MYGTRFTRPDIQTPHSDETVKDVTEFDPGSEPYHNSHPRVSRCGDAGIPDGGSTSDALCAELLNPESTPKDPLLVEGVTNASEMGQSAPRYNLRPLPGRNL